MTAGSLSSARLYDPKEEEETTGWTDNYLIHARAAVLLERLRMFGSMMDGDVYNHSLSVSLTVS